MRIKAIPAAISSLMIVRLLAAPISDDHGRTLIVARGVAPALPASVPAYTGPGNRLASFAPPPNKIAPKWHGAVSHLNTNSPLTASHTAPVQPVTGGGAPCSMSTTGTRTSTICPKNSPLRDTSNDIFLHPDGPNGPDTRTLKRVTIGKRIGAGGFGDAFDVASHDLSGHTGDLVAKKYRPVQYSKDPEGTQWENEQEAQNLRRMHQLHASGTAGGQDWIVMKKIPGQQLTETNAHQNAKTPEEVAAVEAHANELVGTERLRVASKHNLIHDDLHAGNIKYESNGDKLVRARFLDWARASKAPDKQADGKFAPDIEHAIRSGQVFGDYGHTGSGYYMDIA